MTLDCKASWEAYRSEQSHGGYDYHPGDEHIFRDAWNLALRAAVAALREPSEMGNDAIIKMLDEKIDRLTWR